MSQPLSDTELIERIGRRDPEALAVAYDRYSAIAFSVFLRIVRDRSAAEDLLQELFLRLWARARHFDASKGALGVWLLAVARNMGIDYLRSAQARFQTRTRPIEDVDPLFLSGDAKQPEMAAGRRQITEALSKLNENERRALELAYFEGLSQTEIAQRMQEPLGTVKSWVRSGLARLRNSMKAGAVQA